MTTPLEANARLLIGVLARYFPTGATCEDLRRRFEKNTSLARQSFYNALRYAKQQGWFVGGGPHQLYTLSTDGSWKEPPVSVGEQLDAAKRNNDRLEYLADSREVQIEELMSQLESLRDWSSGSNTNGIAVSNLAQIVSDSAASTRQRLRAAAALIAYRVQDPGVIEFAKRFLESLCANADIPTDYRIEAGELLRRHEAPRVMSESVRPTYRTDDSAAEPPPEDLQSLVRRQRERCDRLLALSLEERSALIKGVGRSGAGSNED
jgi:hypothetical protein